MREKIFVKLTKKQQEALNKMQRENWYCCYELRASLATLNALKKKGVVKAKCEDGYLYSPRTCIFFKVI